jgi:hypothetical protein
MTQAELINHYSDRVRAVQEKLDAFESSGCRFFEGPYIPNRETTADYRKDIEAELGQYSRILRHFSARQQK